MRYLIDTNICIYLINAKPRAVAERFGQLNIDEVAISEITVSELQFGVTKSQHHNKNQERLAHFLRPFTVLPYQAPASHAYAQLRADLERRGQVIGALDMLIAAQAIAEDLILVTNNTNEFQRIVGLKLENWV